MKIFCVDPFLLAYPRFNEELDFDNYLNTLLVWGDFIDSHRDNIYISFITFDVLAKVNGYPEWDELKKILNHPNWEGTIDPHDIINIINNMLNLPLIEDRINITEILFEEEVECNPADHLLEREAILRENYYRVAILECLLEKLHYDQQHQKIHKILATRHNTKNSQTITLKAKIVDYELIDESKPITLNKPYLVEGNLTSCVNPKYLPNFYNSVLEQAIDIWRNATSEKMYDEAIQLCVKDTNNQLQQPRSANNLLSWSFGNKFLETVKNLGFINEDTKIKMLLRSCAETIREENMRNTHCLRTGKGGNEDQRERTKDSAKAWRRDIDREYHLHYWKTANKIEFASVVTHNDMTIPE